MRFEDNWRPLTAFNTDYVIGEGGVVEYFLKDDSGRRFQWMCRVDAFKLAKPTEKAYPVLRAAWYRLYRDYMCKIITGEQLCDYWVAIRKDLNNREPYDMALRILELFKELPSFDSDPLQIQDLMTDKQIVKVK